MSQGVEEEVFVPSCFESFDPGGGLVGVGLEDVCGEASQECKISGAVILAVSSEILVEDDVLLPMTSILDVPMATNDVEEIERREAAGGDEHPFLPAGFAIEGALGYDPRPRGQAF